VGVLLEIQTGISWCLQEKDMRTHGTSKISSGSAIVVREEQVGEGQGAAPVTPRGTERIRKPSRGGRMAPAVAGPNAHRQREHKHDLVPLDVES
jgi:hypothetical protein